MIMQDIIIKVITDILLFIATVAAVYIVRYLKAKAEYIKSSTLKETIRSALTSVEQAVVYVMQTYVDTLKNQGKFDKYAQKEALQKAKQKAQILIDEGIKSTIENQYGSFDTWLATAIEQSVRQNKI